ncbi:MAG: lipopolysaccharide biosynthesis protein, partial [Proteobacteria bacterium]
MSNPVRKRLIKSFAAQGFGQVINIIIQVFSVPIFLHFWGKELYGEWLLLSTIPTYLSLSDFGFASAAGNDMTMRVARGDKDGALAVFQSVWVLISAISLVLTSVLLVSAKFLPLVEWFRLTRITPAEVVTIVTFLTLQVSVAQQMGLLGAGFRSDGNYARGVTASNLQRLAEFLAGVVVLYMGAGPVTLSGTVLLIGFFSNTIIRFDLKRRSPWLSIGWKYASMRLIKQVAGPAIAFMGFPIGHALSLQGVVTVVG